MPRWSNSCCMSSRNPPCLLPEPVQLVYQRLVSPQHGFAELPRQSRLTARQPPPQSHPSTLVTEPTSTFFCRSFDAKRDARRRLLPVKGQGLFPAAPSELSRLSSPLMSLGSGEFPRPCPRIPGCTACTFSSARRNRRRCHCLQEARVFGGFDLSRRSRFASPAGPFLPILCWRDSPRLS